MLLMKMVFNNFIKKYQILIKCDVNNFLEFFKIFWKLLVLYIKKEGKKNDSFFEICCGLGMDE